MKRFQKSFFNFPFAFFFLCVLFPLCGCSLLGSSPPKTDYYTLEYDSPKVTGLNALPSIIKIDRFYASPLYNSEKISYRKSDFQTDEYIYKRWETNPAQLISYFIYRDIKQSGIFKGVFSHDTGYAATHSVSGTVDEFYEDDRGKTWEAVLSLDIVLMAENEPDINKRIIFQKKYSARKPCIKKNPQAVAEAMSKAMSELSGQIITDIHKSLSGKI
ncbi:MAG: trans aux protein [Thermodesulfobacteriota bacterium]|nr:trans aux protein [Thermodesulfobacteriota bacterium]